MDVVIAFLLMVVCGILVITGVSAAAVNLLVAPKRAGPLQFTSTTTGVPNSNLKWSLSKPEKWPLKQLLRMRHTDGRAGYVLAFTLSRLYVGDTTKKSTEFYEFSSEEAFANAGWSIDPKQDA